MITQCPYFGLDSIYIQIKDGIRNNGCGMPFERRIVPCSSFVGDSRSDQTMTRFLCGIARENDAQYL